MNARQWIAIMVAGAAMTLAATPGEAATKRRPDDGVQVAAAGRHPARVTVRRRSYLNPGTETKARAEHYTDYAFPPGHTDPMNNSTLFNFGAGNRMPFPSCFDLPGFCQ